MFDEDNRAAPWRTSLILYRCRRCLALVEVPDATPDSTLQRAVERAELVSTHRCHDGALGVIDAIGSGPGRSREASTAATGPTP